MPEIGFEEILGVCLYSIVTCTGDDLLRRGDAGRVERVQRFLLLPERAPYNRQPTPRRPSAVSS